MSSRSAAPSAPRARARAARASVTSLASSAGRAPSGVAGIGGLQRLVVRLGGDPAYEHRADPGPPALCALGGELDAVQPHLRPGDRDPAQVLGQQATDRVDVVVLELDVEALGELVEMQAGTDPQGAV